MREDVDLRPAGEIERRAVRQEIETGLGKGAPPLTGEAAVELLNGFFDCLVPPIEREGGEVLKYLEEGQSVSADYRRYI